VEVNKYRNKKKERKSEKEFKYEDGREEICTQITDERKNETKRSK
jgi:hypothetical protein